ncbi:cobalt-precorrin-6A reductase [Kamptonema sp. UHCC 0994]|uniref:cobalt-precorrin-6A reductase n=1 Tax=Kamptonema sp. UHCC 0994 TaxID=3031329 RepID=UPI0023B9D3FD|nr:cobalt-precorrin-6A reductase [Kamptonema sp. UHCC 0994]MDF0555172.1 cobalt-precorrin-6A reductase [Kamptonema sp. UHCC 0994]
METLSKKRLLILGGTSDATKLAARASFIPGVDVLTSLAGRTRQPHALIGNVRIGGFGGAAGLAGYLRDREINFLIDATHPYAVQISFNAAEAANECNLPHLMLVRPPWEKQEGDRWIEVESNEAAAIVLSKQAERVFLTIGRQELAAYAHLDDIWFLMRMIDPPAAEALIPNGKLLLDRGPFTLENEQKLLIAYQIDAIASKNSGGDATYAKIVAARELEIPVVMVQRKLQPAVEQVADIESAIRWLLNQL